MIVTHEKCYICGAITDFTIIESATLVREATCINCGASLRNSDVSKTICNIAAGKNNDMALVESIECLKKLTILEASSTGPIHNLLKDLPGYHCFEYFDSIRPGEYYNGICCNDLRNLTYKDNSFDLIITQDVLEHIDNPSSTFVEINRVLKLQGHHIFTVPLHENKRTLSRKGLKEVFHGDPVREQGAIVHIDWGYDICDIIDRFGMKTKEVIAHRFHQLHEITDVDNNYADYLENEHVEYFKYNSIVFVSQKIKRRYIWGLLAKGLYRICH